MSFSYYDSPLGKIKIEEKDNCIVGIRFVSDSDTINKKEVIENEIISICKIQLDEYFNGVRKEFDLKIKFLNGTDFQRSVWNELRKIPYGGTIS